MFFSPRTVQLLAAAAALVATLTVASPLPTSDSGVVEKRQTACTAPLQRKAWLGFYLVSGFVNCKTDDTGRLGNP